MDSALETTAEIPNLTVNNLVDIPFGQMLKILEPFVLIEVPEFNTELASVRQRYDYLLARTANVYAYLQLLHVHASYERARLKMIDSPKADDILKKKEALYELANAVKLKYEAVSRKITLAMGEDGDQKVTDRANYDSRRDTAAGRPNQWSAKSEATAKRPGTDSAGARSGGWGNV